MSKIAPLEALLEAYREQIRWLNRKAANYEKINSLEAADYVHGAQNLQAIIDAYDRSGAKKTKDA